MPNFEKPQAANENDEDFEVDIDVSDFEDKRDPEMIDAKVDESGKFGRPRILAEETVDQAIGSPESDAERQFLDELADTVVTERGGPFGRLIAPHDDLVRQMKGRMASALQNLRFQNKEAKLGPDELREALLKQGVEIAQEIFNANKDRIERDLDNPERRAA